MARFFFIFHALSFELNFSFDRRFPLSLFARALDATLISTSTREIGLLKRLSLSFN